MIQEAAKKEVMDRLRKEILAAEGLQRPTYEPRLHLGLQALEMAFPDQTFPTGCIHEFISPDTERAAATTGFIAALLSHIAVQKGPCVWVSRQHRIFAPALLSFGLQPDQVIFINPDKDKDLLWTTEQALKCSSLTAVIADVQELDLTASRRLQLAVEQSRVTGFLHRHNPRTMGHTACVARWQVQSLCSEATAVPGLGFPRWQVNLLKVRNGRPGSWIVDWTADQFRITEPVPETITREEAYTYTKVAQA
ncbi:Error-prone repair protein ImuA [Taibaiella sp. KBW10]|uniref:ImuA family protein n=1 Tax=Taibaiella sp. KBW10 TaxID=2153357 RepID=UPI000F59F73C|nr:Error-prone repair protein ImuA [Taibaiella sp. KBW10]RQO31957.1 Error-prone repair protein ImuA [Taibaiella sp. KBW10]